MGCRMMQGNLTPAYRIHFRICPSVTIDWKFKGVMNDEIILFFRIKYLNKLITNLNYTSITYLASTFGVERSLV